MYLDDENLCLYQSLKSRFPFIGLQPPNMKLLPPFHQRLRQNIFFSHYFVFSKITMILPAAASFYFLASHMFCQQHALNRIGGDGND